MHKAAIPPLKRSEDLYWPNRIADPFPVQTSLFCHPCSLQCISSGVCHYSATVHGVVNHQKCSREIKSKMHLDLALSEGTLKIVGSGVVKDTWMLLYFLPGLSVLQIQQPNLYNFASLSPHFKLSWLDCYYLNYFFYSWSYTSRVFFILSCP